MILETVQKAVMSPAITQILDEVVHLSADEDPQFTRSDKEDGLDKAKDAPKDQVRLGLKDCRPAQYPPGLSGLAANDRRSSAHR